MKELITPHKVSILTLIRIFGTIKLKHLRTKVFRVDPITPGDIKNVDMENFLENICTPRYRRNFNMMLLNLIQGPDMTLYELRCLLKAKEDVIFPGFHALFMIHLEEIIHLDIEGILELISRVNALLTEPTVVVPVVTKTSVLGLYIRRHVVQFEKLSCSAVVSIFKAFKAYFNSCPKFVKDDQNPARQLEFNSPVPPDEDEVMLQSSVAHDLQDTIVLPKESGAWTRRQAELFLAQQSSLILKNETLALPTEELHTKIEELLYAAPECTEAYFLSYMNFLRVKDFYGALHSLYHYFDRGAGFHTDRQGSLIPGTTEDKARSFRYGALNLAMFHAKFGHNKEAMLALKECVMLAHGSSCNFCLQHALCWMYRLSDDDDKVALMERSIARSNELGLNYLASLGYQSLAQFSACFKKFKKMPQPAAVFELVAKSDVLNCHHSMLDLAANNYTLKSTLWSLYGRSAMSGLYSQLLLHSEAQESNSEATCLALCVLATKLMSEGDSSKCATLLWYTKDRFPQLETQKVWNWCDTVLNYEHSMRQGHWQDARRAAEELAATDTWECTLRLAELQLMQGDRHGALDRVNEVIQHTDSNNDMSPNLQVRALILKARIMGTDSTHGAQILISALSLAESSHLTNLSTIITVEIAQHQLVIGLPAQAMSLLSKVLLSILSHGSVYEQAEALFLQAKCRVAIGKRTNQEAYINVLPSVITSLNIVKEKFEKCQAVSKVREVLLMQALLYHSQGNHVEKYRLSLELRNLDDQVASKTSSHV